MKIEENNREASATIKGFIYQFDSTILSILESIDDSIFTIEGIEDFDILKSKKIECFQCKYYESTKLTDSTLRDMILPSLQNYKNLNQINRMNFKFTLYGYFKESSPKEIHIDLNEIKRCLVKKERNHEHNSLSIINLQEKYNLSDTVLQEFAEKTRIVISENFEVHKQKVIKKLMEIYRVTFIEAESLLYPTARTIISNLASQRNLSNRIITRQEFIEKVNPSRTLFNIWFLREKEHKQYCQTIRGYYFCHANIESFTRIFVIDCDILVNFEDYFSICYEIRRKWSSHCNKRKMNRERYVPILLFNKIKPNNLVEIKKRLHSEHIKFTDGFPFQGSGFQIEDFLTPQTYENQISLRLISDFSDLITILQRTEDRKTIYWFFKDKYETITLSCNHVVIPVEDTNSIINII